MHLLHGRTQHVIAFVDGDQDWTQEAHQELLCPAIFLDWDIKKKKNSQMLIMAQL